VLDVGVHRFDVMNRVPLLLLGLVSFFIVTNDAQDLVINVNLTLLDVSVEDADGRSVLDLRAEDFEIVENGRATPVTHSSLEVDPIDIAFAIDRSSSIVAVREQMEKTLGQLLEGLWANDRVFLNTFAGVIAVSALTAAPPGTSFLIGYGRRKLVLARASLMLWSSRYRLFPQAITGVKRSSF
jgi:hypothetical protein